MKVIGIDPGSKSFDLFGIEFNENPQNNKEDVRGHEKVFDKDSPCTRHIKEKHKEKENNGFKIFLDTSIPTRRVMEDPSIIIEQIESHAPFDLLGAPSGFGLPFRELKEITPKEQFEMVLKQDEKNKTIGLRNLIEKLRVKNWKSYVLPGVKHLPTVPSYRKINKIDMGTADKVCSSVVGIRYLCEEYNLPVEDINMILIEIGAAFSAVIAVEKGKIIDGIGGSNLMGINAVGALDAEIAYLMKTIEKKDIYRGGVSSIIGYNDLGIQEIVMLSQRDRLSKNALTLYIENITKAVYSEYALFKEKPLAILLSGRGTQEEALVKTFKQHLSKLAPVKIIKSYAKIAKRAAQGAAFILEGILNPQSLSGEIVRNMEITQSKGSVLDDIYLPLKRVKESKLN